QLIYDDYKLKQMIESLVAMGCEGLVLGCTHFPYLLNQIKKDITVPVINPGDKMLELLKSN
ncbi:MAG: aspartate/glutamate racemase family protein, partial [Oscillospiraceae bacterium]